MHKILSLIIETKKKRIEVLKKNREGFLSLIKKAPAPISFKKAIKREGKISLIAEIKQASPSAGILCKDFNYIELAKKIEKMKASAISVITEEDFFLGKINYIEEIKKISNLPIIRKDFILDEVQVLESRAVGADAILLIMGILDEKKLEYLYNLSKKLGMDVLVEVRTEKELKKVLKFGADIIGINNRNLHTFQVNLERSKNLVPFIPEGVVRVSESGISSLKEVLLLKGLGIDAVLVGSSFMTSEDIEGKLKELNIDG
ncbi:MAG: indole-3-glycerol phosphate synthase TrpC [Candidatus Omnitrophica bacterium]|nr:indole-3-glycerol phosphate synthase TrpC [Candidatus Omnitrophota bacterium]MCK5288741.1 indole-3-glycerol phosphate synthase TrpC [Candidatus Omnitrophota bacterium]